MFLTLKHLSEFGYQVMGIKFHSNSSYYNYVKYFPEHNSMVVFSTVFNNRVLVYRLTKDQYRDFQDGKYALSHDGNGYGSTPTGHPVKNHSMIVVFSGGEISRKQNLKDMLDVAEELAQGKKVEYEFVIKRHNSKIKA